MAGKKLGFEKTYAELEALVTDLESREIELETDLPKFERGMKLAKQLTAKISAAENTIEEISLKYGDETV